MPFYTDLHIHSKYSRATSKNGNLDELAIWARKKGLNLIATGDFTHPAWFEEIKEKLVPLGDGTFKLKDGASDVKFLLNVEISTIYKKGDKTRKVHHVVFMPNLEAAEKFRNRLSAIGNINSDGRPILGLDSRNLLEIVLESSDDAFLIPAHIWTPWFSALGSKSGFNSIEECYDDLSPYIFAVETGLSSDPEMNWHVSSLDKYRLVSNSDAHSPANLAREATVFERELDYSGIMNALKNGDGYLGTVEFFPEEGKYHEDGHRKCNVCLTPEETAKVGGICPVCGKPLTIGVLNRVNELSDRKGVVVPPPKAGKVFSLVPLPEILSEIMRVGSSSKSVVAAYEDLIKKLGSELDILQTIPIEDISKAYSSLLGEGISRLRQGKVIRQAGFDGEYGIIRLFNDSELEKSKLGSLLFDIKTPEKKQKLKTHVEEFDLKNILDNVSKQNNEKQKPFELDEYQLNAVNSSSHQLLIVAGPGSGKTTVLTKRIANMISKNIISAENCLAITFTRRAADEMRSRLKYNINIQTFHSLCFSILKENYEAAGLKPDFQVSADSKILKKIDDADEEDNEDLKDGKLNNDDLLSFDDLIILAVKLLKENENIANFYREKFKYVSVDEYQDIDEKQYELIRLLVPSNGSICVIGDPNQAIYGFRGGDSRFFKILQMITRKPKQSA